MVQWLRLSSNAEGVGSVTVWVAKLPTFLMAKIPKKKKQENQNIKNRGNIVTN